MSDDEFEDESWRVDLCACVGSIRNNEYFEGEELLDFDEVKSKFVRICDDDDSDYWCRELALVVLAKALGSMCSNDYLYVRDD